jgi:hypothetical protein
MIQASESARALEWENFMAQLQTPRIEPAPEPVVMSAAEFRAYVEQQEIEHMRKTARMLRFLIAYSGIVGTLGLGCWLIFRQW